MIMAMWTNPAGTGPPDQQWFSDETFDTFEEAERFYFKFGRSRLRKIEKEIKKGLKPGAKITHWEGDPLKDEREPVKEFEPVQTADGPVTLSTILPEMLHAKYKLQSPNTGGLAQLVKEQEGFITSNDMVAAITLVDTVDNEMNAVFFVRPTPDALMECVDLIIDIGGDPRGVVFTRIKEILETR